MAIKETMKFTHEQMYGGPEKEILMSPLRRGRQWQKARS